MRALVSRCISAAECAALLLLGGGMVWLSRSEAYWSFLNPKFRPLTLAGGAGLVLLALALSLNMALNMAAQASSRSRRPVLPRVSPLLALLLFLALAAWAVGGVLALRQEASQSSAIDTATNAGLDGPASQSLNGFDAGPPPGPSPTFSDAPPPPPSRLTRQGREYVKLNLMELWMLSDAATEDAESAEAASLPDHLALRGQVLLLPGDASGTGDTIRWAVARTAVTCCLADAVAVGFVVDAPLPPGVGQGDWVRLLGELEPLAGDVPVLGRTGLPGVVMTLVHERSMIRAEAVEPAPAPELPFMFEFHGEEPYAY